MSKYVTGLKRNQLIQRWLQGVEDPDYEVFPTKKEGKYIVKKRVTPIEVHNDTSLSESLNDTSFGDTKPLAPQAYSCETRFGNQTANADQQDNSELELEPTTDQVKQSVQVLAKQSPKRTSTKKALPQNSYDISYSQGDTTVNLEILEQLRALGEEIRSERVKKEQKQYIKHVVNKELTKSRIRNRFQYDPDNQYDTSLSESFSDTKPLTAQVYSQDNSQNELVPTAPFPDSQSKKQMENLVGDENKQPLSNTDSYNFITQVQPEFKSRIRRN